MNQNDNIDNRTVVNDDHINGNQNSDAVNQNEVTAAGSGTQMPQSTRISPNSKKKMSVGRIVWLSVLLIALLTLVATQILMVMAAIRSKMFPAGWLTGMIGCAVFISGSIAFLMFVRFKKPVGVARKIIALILVAVFVIPFYLGGRVTKDARKTVEEVTGVQPQEIMDIYYSARGMYVLVLAEDPAGSIQHTAGYPYGVIDNYNVTHTERAIQKVDDAIDSHVDITGFAKLTELGTALYQQKVKAVIMNGVCIERLCEEKGYEDFTSRVRILFEMSYNDLRDPDEKEPIQPKPVQPIPLNLTQVPFVFYLSGSDTRNNMLSVSRSDVNILVIVNPVTHQILMVNTPRDYHVPNPVGDGALDKLTHCGLYGPQCSMQVLEDLYDVEINFYGQINFRGFETLVDAMGGVTVHSNQAFRAGTTYIQVGENYLDGAAALEYARERHRVSGGDNGRGENQMRLVKAMIEKLTSGTTILTRYSEILGSLEGMFKTSATADDISTLVRFQLDEMPGWNIPSYAVTGIAGNAPNYSSPGTTAYVTHIDQASVDYAAELIDRVCNGDILTAEDMKRPK